MAAVLLLILILGVSIGPYLWVRWVLWRYREERSDIPGTGAELAEHLLNRFELEGYVVEETRANRDHFDPAALAVRLGSMNYHGRSLTAVAIAAHEVGHAIQCHRQEPIFRLRSQYVPLARKLERLGIGLISISPLLAVVLRSPLGLALPLFGGLMAALCGALVYLFILPEEWDASFYKAMPILVDGGYISEDDVPVVRRILRAAALTYFAGALASIVQVWRWLPVLLRR